MLLKGGSWVASLTVAAGLLLMTAQPGRPQTGAHQAGMPLGTSIVKVGIALFIALPVLRLVLMLGVFLHRRDYRFSAVTALVLLIVLAGCVTGAQMRLSMPG